MQQEKKEGVEQPQRGRRYAFSLQKIGQLRRIEKEYEQESFDGGQLWHHLS